jgi:hypothetical protein
MSGTSIACNSIVSGSVAPAEISTSARGFDRRHFLGRDVFADDGFLLWRDDHVLRASHGHAGGDHQAGDRWRKNFFTSMTFIGLPKHYPALEPFSSASASRHSAQI